MELENKSSFKRIYDERIWECNGILSGAGSVPGGTVEYINYLQKFKNKNVLDLGCGDCHVYGDIPIFKSHIGIDLVDINNYVKIPDFVEFLNESILDVDFKKLNFDLVIIKDVFQHVSNDVIFSMIRRFDDFEKCEFIITNDFNSEGCNIDCTSGDYRPLDLKKSPFEFKCIESFVWRSKFDNRIKETIYLDGFKKF